MTTPNDIADRLRRTMHGPMWHGPAVLDAVGDLSAHEAAQHPIPGAHSAWELVLHVAAWAEIAEARMNGRAWIEPSLIEDWPPAAAIPTERAWSAAKRRAVNAYKALARAVGTRPVESLTAPVIGHAYTQREMLDGVVEHGVYHAAQIVLLRRVSGRTTV